MATYRINYEKELYHFGVKGMKWGSRKTEKVTVSGKRGNRLVKGKLSGYNKNLHTVRGKYHVKALNNAIKGTKIADITVDGVSRHAVERMLKRKIKSTSVINAAKKPLHITEPKVDEQGRTSRQAIG